MVHWVGEVVANLNDQALEEKATGQCVLKRDMDIPDLAPRVLLVRVRTRRDSSSGHKNCSVALRLSEQTLTSSMATPENKRRLPGQQGRH